MVFESDGTIYALGKARHEQLVAEARGHPATQIGRIARRPLPRRLGSVLLRMAAVFAHWGTSLTTMEDLS